MPQNERNRNVAGMQSCLFDLINNRSQVDVQRQPLQCGSINQHRPFFCRNQNETNNRQRTNMHGQKKGDRHTVEINKKKMCVT